MKTIISLTALCLILAGITYQASHDVQYERTRYDEINTKYERLYRDNKANLKTIQGFRNGDKYLAQESYIRDIEEDLALCREGTTKFYCVYCENEMVGIPTINTTILEVE